MSKSGNERSNFRGRGSGDGGGGSGAGGGGGGGSVDGDDGDEDDAKERRGYVYGKAKHLVSFPFRKAKKQLVYSRRRKSRSISSPRSSGKREGFLGCYLCFKQKQPHTIESPSANSQTSDPNNPAFTYDHLKLLIEKNDFYSKESNPHLGIP